MLQGQDGPRLAFQRGEVAHEIIERLQLARPCILHHPIEPAVLRFAREDRNAQRLGLTDFQRDLRQHGETARSVEAADTDRQARDEEGAGEVDGTGKLVGLHTDQPDQSPRPPPRRIMRMMRSGRTRRLVSS